MNPPDKKSGPDEQHMWERGWDGHEQQQLQRLAKLSLPEKLAWLEEAHRMVRQMAAKENSRANSKQ